MIEQHTNAILETLFFVDIGESKSSALAQICHFSNSYKVCGFARINNEFTNRLKEIGITIYQDIKEEYIKNCSAVVCTNDIPYTFDAIRIAVEYSIPIMNESEILGCILKDFSFRIGISGTHGKTSVISMITHILQHSREEFSCLCDAFIDGLDNNFKINEARKLFIYEANDDNEAFLATYPSSCVILNLEYSHTDYYANIFEMKKAYEKFCNLPFDNEELSGCIIANGDDENVCEVVKDIPHTVLKYGIDGDNLSYRAVNIKEKKGYYSFYVETDNTIEGPVRLKIPGKYNIYNALAAIAIAETNGIYIGDACDALSSFTKVTGRFELVNKIGKGISVYEDFSHHPKEIESVITSAKEMTKGKVIVIYEPHSYRRTRDLYNSYISALSLADTVILLDIVSEYEMDNFGLSASSMSARIKGSFYALNYESATNLAKNIASRDDIIIVMGDGNVRKLIDYFE